MYINTRINKVYFMDCDALGNYGMPELEAMYDYCETLEKERKSYDLDSLILELEDVGNTIAKGWQLSCANEFADSRDCYMELMITFENRFYICLKPCYYLEGRCQL